MQIPFSVEAMARLDGAGAPGGRFLIVDQAAVRGIDVGQELAWSLEMPVDLLTGRGANWQDGASPVLLEAPLRPSRRQLRRWQDFATKWSLSNALTLLISELPASDLADQLRMRLRASLSEGLQVVLRWYDGRVLDAMLQVMSEPQQEALVSPAIEWLWQARDGSARSTRPHGRAQGAETALPFMLTAEQESALLVLGEADVIVDALLRHGNGVLAELPPPKQYERIKTLLGSARQYGIDHAPDQIAFCSVGLAQGDDFHCVTPWSALLDTAQAHGLRFSALLAQLKDQL